MLCVKSFNDYFKYNVTKVCRHSIIMHIIYMHVISHPWQKYRIGHQFVTDPYVELCGHALVPHQALVLMLVANNSVAEMLLLPDSSQ